jgi:hypothetical protein
MCNGIAVLVWKENERIMGACSGISSHDELAHTIPILAEGDIEPYRFELLYPQSLVYDRSCNLSLGTGLFHEQPPDEIWKKASNVSEKYNRKHTQKQLQFAYLRGADLEGADLEWLEEKYDKY